jgi:hypothetical protein
VKQKDALTNYQTINDITASQLGTHDDTKMCLLQGCQMVCFRIKNPNLGKFWRVLHRKMLVHFMDTCLVRFTVFCYILWTFGIVCGNLVYFFPFWYFVPRKIWQPWPAHGCDVNFASVMHVYVSLHQG